MKGGEGKGKEGDEGKDGGKRKEREGKGSWRSLDEARTTNGNTKKQERGSRK